MGITFSTNPQVRGYIKDNAAGQVELLNGPEMQLALHIKGEVFIETAKIVFETHSRHDSTPPIEYLEHFGMRQVFHNVVRAIEIFNDDPTAEWVEFGAHAGGRTRVLNYRVFGRTADFLEARAKLG